MEGSGCTLEVKLAKLDDRYGDGRNQWVSFRPVSAGLPMKDLKRGHFGR